MLKAEGALVSTYSHIAQGKKLCAALATFFVSLRMFENFKNINLKIKYMHTKLNKEQRIHTLRT